MADSRSHHTTYIGCPVSHGSKICWPTSEEFFGQHIIRLPHPYFYEMLGKAAFQPPERIATLNAVDPVQFDYADVDDLIMRKLGLGAPFCAIGMPRS